jgi:hypothetical protein
LARTGEKRHEYTVLEERNYLDGPRTGERITLQLVLNKQAAKSWTLLAWLRTGASGGRRILGPPSGRSQSCIPTTMSFVRAFYGSKLTYTRLKKKLLDNVVQKLYAAFFKVY